MLVERVEKLIPESEWRLAYRDIVDFEESLADDGYLIIKFFLHISPDEQRRRFESLMKDPLMPGMSCQRIGITIVTTTNGCWLMKRLLSALTRRAHPGRSLKPPIGALPRSRFSRRSSPPWKLAWHL